MEKLEALYSSFAGMKPSVVVPLGPSGSHRSYYRLTGPEGSVIGVVGTDVDENTAFVTISRHFLSKGISVPEVLAVSDDGLRYLQEDLGDEMLYDFLSQARESGCYGPRERELLLKVISSLPKIQCEGAEGLDFSVCYPSESFGERMVSFDLNYFKYCYLKTSGVEFNEERLQDDFDRLQEDLLGAGGDYAFMYRDFQARNVMLVDGGPAFIDFQGGRRGPLQYDLASFVWQARARYPQDLKDAMVDAYLDALEPYRRVDRAAFKEVLRIFVLFRTLQVLGAYGYRGRIEKRPHFLESIPYALDNLRDLLQRPFEQYPYLSQVLSELVQTGPGIPAQDIEGLVVTVYSFSFRKGIPEDWSGNGGGYVFDCRGVRNPGRYERFRHLTGLDAPVQEFLEENGEITVFLAHAFEMVDAHAKRFVERGFNRMQVSFGCTGGQHRSAYSAQKTAEHLAAIPGVRVHLIHRELGIESWL